MLVNIPSVKFRTIAICISAMFSQRYGKVMTT